MYVVFSVFGELNDKNGYYLCIGKIADRSYYISKDFAMRYFTLHGDPDALPTFMAEIAGTVVPFEELIKVWFNLTPFQILDMTVDESALLISIMESIDDPVILQGLCEEICEVNSRTYASIAMVNSLPDLIARERVINGTKTS